jgi:hypothetical protein
MSLHGSLHSGERFTQTKPDLLVYISGRGFAVHSKSVFSRATSASLQPGGSVSASHASM